MNDLMNFTALRRRASAVSLFAIGCIILSFVLFIYYTWKQEVEIKTISAIKDTNTTLLTRITDSVQIKKLKHDTLIILAKEYIRLRNNHDIVGLEKLYSDTLSAYFKNLKNTPKEVVLSSDYKYWKRFPNDTFVPIDEPDVILNSNTGKVSIRGTQFRTPKQGTDVYLVFGFNNKDKISYVKAFYSK